ncbi:MAG TPA: cytochrome c peroxidase [Saprospiraceae bacterium]|nr:cytochrome c peroxidase [Saprospiraceae bacterium]
MKKTPFLLLIGFTILLSACQIDDPMINDYDTRLQQSLQAIGGSDWQADFTLPDSDDFSAIPQDPRNPLSEEKVALGQLLFHETALALNPTHTSGEGTYSCASCHFAGAGFQANRWQGIGDGGMGAGANGMARTKSPDYLAPELDVQPIRSPTTLNTAFQRVMLWNGQFGATGPNRNTEAAWTTGTPKENNHLGYEGLETQAIAGLGVHRIVIDYDRMEDLGYIERFDQAFPEIEKPQRYSTEMAGLAIAAYERTLFANEAPFQQWLRGDRQAMTEIEKQGAMLFFGKAQCAPCHGGPALNSEAFHAFGMKDLDQIAEETFMTPSNAVEHRGRGGFTGNPADNYKFKVPQLYNLSDSPFLGHGSSLRSIREVVAYKNTGIPENSRVPEQALSNHFRPLGLTEQEVDAITVFLESALHDDNLTRYQPDQILSGNCFPFADPMAKVDMGCQ